MVSSERFSASPRTRALVGVGRSQERPGSVTLNASCGTVPQAHQPVLTTPKLTGHRSKGQRSCKFNACRDEVAEV